MCFGFCGGGVGGGIGVVVVGFVVVEGFVCGDDNFLVRFGGRGFVGWGGGIGEFVEVEFYDWDGVDVEIWVVVVVKNVVDRG